MNHRIRPSFLVGLIGAGIQASRTPLMHEQEADEQGLRYLYRLLDLDTNRADRLAASLCVHFGAGRAVGGTDLPAAMAAADGLIHATPTGMAQYPGLPLRSELLRPALWVAEIVYFPLETDLVRLARQLGCRTLDGSGMAVFQTVEAFRLFTGIAPDARRMQHTFASMGAS